MVPTGQQLQCVGRKGKEGKGKESKGKERKRLVLHAEPFIQMNT